jgi:hypothetical protein
MKRAVFTVCALVLAVLASAAVFERYLSPDKPADRAILAYFELAKAGKATSRDLAELGVLLLDKGFPDDAEHYLRQALKVDKHNFEAAYRLGLVLQRMGRDKDAVRQYRSVVKQRPGHAYARFMLALAEERSGRHRAAIKDYAKAYRFQPELADPARNPLVLDSDLQTQAGLLHYRDARLAATLKVDAIDPEAVKRMMEAKATPAPTPTPAATPSAVGTPKPTPAAGKPTPSPAKPVNVATPPAKAPVGLAPKVAPRVTPPPATREVPPVPTKAPSGQPAGRQTPQPVPNPIFGLPNVSGTAALRSPGSTSGA